MRGDALRSALRRLVRRMRNRLWLETAGRWFTTGLWGTAGLLLALGALHLSLLPLPPAWGLGIGLLPALAAIAGALLLRRPPFLLAARRLDRGLRAHTLLLAAWDLSARDRAAEGTEALLLARAASRLAEWRKAVGGIASPEWPRSLPLAAAASLGTGLLLLLPGAPVQSSTQPPAATSIPSVASHATALLELAQQSERTAVTQPPRTSNPTTSKPASAVNNRQAAGSPMKPLRASNSHEQGGKPTNPSGAAAINHSTVLRNQAAGTSGAGGRDQVGNAAGRRSPASEFGAELRFSIEQVPLSRTQTANAATTGTGGRLATPQNLPAGHLGSEQLPAAVPPERNLDRRVHSPALRAYVSRYFSLVRTEVKP